MRRVRLAVLLLAPFALVTTVGAQRPLAIEGGIFVQHTRMDEELDLDHPTGIGARLSIFPLIRNLAVEGDIHVASTDWNLGPNPVSVTYRPFAVRLVYGLELNPRSQFLLGAGYQLNVYKGRKRQFGATVAGNEYEDAFTALAGLKFCLNEKWNLRFDVPVDHNPHPNFNGSLQALDGKSTSVGFRVGVGRMLRGACYDRPEPPPPAPLPVTPPPPPPAEPPPPPPNQAPVATISAPPNGASFAGATTFTGSCQDPEQGDVSSNARWESSRDGQIGTGSSFSRTLTPGAHTITLTCTDGQGATSTATVNVTAQQLVVQLNWVYFDFNQAVLTAAGRDTLTRLIVTMRDQPDMRLAVEGHTDPYGSEAYNQQLSERRARAVVDFLTRGGVAPERISWKGFGEQCLLVEDDRAQPTRPRSEHRMNRRVEIWSVGNAGTSPTCRPRQ
ncbi:MAG TPA: OmpA family protein [Gemmatimonadaceae bacterium]